MNSADERLAVHLRCGEARVKVGTLARAHDGFVRFSIDEAYVGMGERRPVLSAAYHVPGDQKRSAALLREAGAFVGGSVPRFFENLLPEGELAHLVTSGLPRHGRGAFDLLRRLGSDLPGAVEVTPDDGMLEAPPSSGHEANLRFSLAGAFMKLSMTRIGDDLVLPSRGVGGTVIAKLPDRRFPSLPEAEYSAMSLAASVGVRTAKFSLLPIDRLHGVDARLLEGGRFAYVTERFDRTPQGMRIHVEDFNQVMGASVAQKYVAANEETVLRIAKIYGGGPAAFLQACRRVAVNVLLGNNDAHLKNWALVYSDPARPSLAPAYDVVPTFLYEKRDALALRFRGSHDPREVRVSKFEEVAAFSDMNPRRVRREVALVVEQAADEWPERLRGLPMPEEFSSAILGRVATLALSAPLKSGRSLR